MVASIKSIQSQNNDLQETLKTFQNTMNGNDFITFENA